MSNKVHLTAGVDAGASGVKVAIMTSRAGVGGEVLHHCAARLRRRDPRQVVESLFAEACLAAGVGKRDFDYITSTGDGDAVPFRSGHFYSMTTHARGALFLDPRARAVLDIGALHARAVRIDERGKVLAHRMTSQCASGSGQFVENIARYLGVPLEDVGALSYEAKAPEVVSSICAVLAETDVIGMVSRDVATADILRGIHMSIAGRLARLLRAIKADGVVLVTGGLAADAGLVASLVDAVQGKPMKTFKGKMRAMTSLPLDVVATEDALFAGAFGAALLGAYRHRQLERKGRLYHAADRARKEVAG